MSARLGFNEIKYQTWKGQTFTQISSKIQKNTIHLNNGSPNIFNARPLRHYRREISQNPTCSGNTRTSLKIAQFEQPGGTLISNETDPIGVETIIDKQFVKPQIQENEIYCNQTASPCLSTQNNALKRTRGAGIIKKTYYSDTKGYLYSRKTSFDQNQYNYISTGTASVDAGSPLSVGNTYYGGGACVNAAKCPVVYKPNNYKYSQQGAVDSSNRMDRLKYDTINTNAASYKGSYGTQTADALAYGGSLVGYTAKNIQGFEQIKTPVISKYTGAMKSCGYVRIKR